MENVVKEKKINIELTSFGLHILAMLFMLSDHLWASAFNQYRWMTRIGRLAFPIFAFMIVEGFFHTRSLKKYFLRLFAFAVISEVPFDLFYGGIVLDITHQNVLWTFLIALTGITLIDKCKNKKWLYIIVSIIVIWVSWVLSLVLMVDCAQIGVLTVYTFYFLRKKTIINMVLQLALMHYINLGPGGGYFYLIKIGNFEYEFVEQGLAILALIPIWLYKGKKGYSSKWFSAFCYIFYPAHALILSYIQTH